MRVAVATWSIRAVGGVEDYISLLLPALVDAGVEVALWHELDRPVDRPRIAVPRQVPVFSAPGSGFNESLESLRAWKPDLLYVQGLTDSAVESALLTIAPAVFFVHSYAGTCISGNKTTTRPVMMPCDRKFGWPCLALYLPLGCGGSSPATMWRLFRRQSRQLDQLRRYSAVLTHSDHMRRELSRHDVHAVVLPFAVRQGNGQSKPRHTAAWRLLFGGRMDLLKGGELLLDALPLVMADLDRLVELTFAGDGPQRERWERRAARLHEQHPGLSIAFRGWLSQEGLARELAETDLLVMPSIWPEPFGSMGPLAAQYGVPAVAFAAGGIGEWLQDGVNGHLAPATPPTAHGLASAIVKCVSDPAHYTELKRGALHTADRFTMRAHLPALLNTFTRAAANRP